MFSLEGLYSATGSYSTLELNNMVVMLRDDAVRADPRWKEIIPGVLKGYSNDPKNTARVAVNYAADNDENRAFLISDDPIVQLFWASAIEDLDGKDNDACFYITVLLSQYLHNIAPETKTELLEKFTGFDIVRKLIAYCDLVFTSPNRGEYAMEVLAEYASIVPQKFSGSDLKWAANICDTWNRMPDNESGVINASALVLSLAQNETLVIDSASTIEVLYQAMASATSSEVKRILFSACGYVTSAPSYTNSGDIETNVENILSSKDAYVVAAAAVSLGNCVDSDASRTQLLDSIGSQWPQVVRKVVSWPYGDVSLLQALHLFNNTMTGETLAVLLEKDSYDLLCRITKVAVDNSTYHREVAELFFKFLRKLLVSGHMHHPLDYKDVWDYIGNADSACGRGVVDMHLLQTLVSDHHAEPSAELLKRLFDETLTSGDSVDAHVILLKLHTVAVVLQKWNLARLQAGLGVHFDPMVEKLRILMEQIEQVELPKTAQGAAVANNTQYVAAACVATFKGNSSLLVQVCGRIAKADGGAQ